MSQERYYNNNYSNQYPERERSREKHHSSYRGRSQSPQDQPRKKKASEPKAIPKPIKRVKFSSNTDIKVFRKEDEPSSKGMSESQVLEYLKKIETEKGASFYSISNWDINWDNAKHRDALLEQHSMKEQREKQKVLNEKLQGMKEEIDYYPPFLLNIPATEIKIEPPGLSSNEKQIHSNRLNDTLSCFYANRKQIPSDPTFQIQNKSTKSTSQPKNISFDKLMFNDLKDLSINQKGSQPGDKYSKLKGILKLSPNQIKKEISEKIQPSQIDPKLIQILRDIHANKTAYTKEKSELLLKPYKESGQLDLLTKNPEILNNILRSSVPPPQPVPPISTQPPAQVYPPRPMPSPSPQARSISNDMRSGSAGRYEPNPSQGYQNTQSNYGYQNQNQQYGNYNNNYKYGSYQNQYSNYQYQQQQQQPQQQQMGSMNQTQTPYVNKNYRTVPCKYFHSVQGCVKGNNCTYIHEEEYAGRPSPRMQNYGMGGMNTYNDNPGMMGGQRYSEDRNRSSSDRQMGYDSTYQNVPPGMSYPKPPGQYPAYGYTPQSQLGNNQNTGNQYGYNYPYMGQNQNDYKSGQ